MPSIRQSAYSDLLPDFRNLAVMARVLVGVNALALVGAFYASSAIGPALDRFIRTAAFLEPLLLIELSVLFVLGAWLARLPYWTGCLILVFVVTLIAGGYHAFHETRRAGVPTIYIPQRRRYDDQWWRVRDEREGGHD